MGSNPTLSANRFIPLLAVLSSVIATDAGQVRPDRCAEIVMSEIRVPVSFGELLDKIAILAIKSERIAEPEKRANVRRELDALVATWAAHPASARDIGELRRRLREVNERLWDIEDAIREKEHAQAFDADFIRLARSVYFENDERARIKREINVALGSALVEEKSYRPYREVRA